MDHPNKMATKMARIILVAFVPFEITGTVPEMDKKDCSVSYTLIYTLYKYT